MVVVFVLFFVIAIVDWSALWLFSVFCLFFSFLFVFLFCFGILLFCFVLIELFSYLVAHEYYSHEDLVALTQKQFDKIVRQVRVGAFEEVNEPAKRKRIDKLLVKFEKEWRKSCGVNKTSQLSNY